MVDVFLLKLVLNLIEVMVENDEIHIIEIDEGEVTDEFEVVLIMIIIDEGEEMDETLNVLVDEIEVTEVTEVVVLFEDIELEVMEVIDT